MEACDIPVPDAWRTTPSLPPSITITIPNSALLPLLFLNKSHYMHRAQKRTGVPQQPPSTRPSARGSGSDSDARSGVSVSVPSPTDSVDSVFIEQFSSSNSSPDDSVRGQRSSTSESESSDNSQPSRGWISKLANRALRIATKRAAKKSLNELARASSKKNPTAQRERCEAAAALVKIIKSDPDGEDIVARKIIKKASRQEQCTRALLKLSDDELDQFGYKAANPAPDSISFQKLLRVMVKHTNESRFLRQIISVAMNGKEGSAAILFLALTETDSFFINIKCDRLLSFCQLVLAAEAPLSTKWYCAAKLLCNLLPHLSLSFFRREYEQMTTRVLISVCDELIQNVPDTLEVNANEESEKGLAATPDIPLGFPFLPLVALCFDSINRTESWFALVPPDAPIPLIERLITFVDPEDPARRRRHLNTERGYALSTLLSLLESRAIVTAIPQDTLTRLGAMFVDMVLYNWSLEIHAADIPEKELLKPLKSNLAGCSIHGLCLLPQSTFNGALASALDDGILQLNSPKTRHSYEPLGLVQRLLWLSNLRQPMDHPEQVLHALVKGDACGFLTNVLSHKGYFSPQDRGLWRAKGLAVTCLGNIVERMDEAQFRDHVPVATIDAVVAIKEHEDVPLVQKGQAIFMLQRYTLAADRWGVRPHYWEDTSNVDEGFRNPSVDDTQSP